MTAHGSDNHDVHIFCRNCRYEIVNTEPTLCPECGEMVDRNDRGTFYYNHSMEHYFEKLYILGKRGVLITAPLIALIAIVAIQVTIVVNELGWSELIATIPWCMVGLLTMVLAVCAGAWVLALALSRISCSKQPHSRPDESVDQPEEHTGHTNS